MIQRPGKYFVILLSTIIFIAGCSMTGGKNKEYFNSAKEFNNIYFQVVDKVELNNDIKSLKALQSEENRKNIERLGILLENIRQTIPKNRDPLYNNFKSRYDDLVYLRDSYARFDKLSGEERGRIDLVMIKIAGYKADRNNKKSTTVWE